MNLFSNALRISHGTLKPRSSRLTMVLDKSLGTLGVADLIETAGDYVDIVKLGWGTCALYSDEVLKLKIQMYRKAGIDVCPGGTFIETLYEHMDMGQALDMLKNVGFNAIEVSNGIHPKMTRSDKLEIIRLAVSKGFRTVSEVGKKLPEEDRMMSHAQRIEEILEDLANGASKVIMESRESGTVGIFTHEGKINADLAYELFQKIDPDKILWEAPIKMQQVWLLQQLGSEANIGNVSPVDILSLESMRKGLRADTFRDYCRDNHRIFLELGVGGAMRAQQRGDVIIVVDALRASTTIVQCIEKGAREVIPIVDAHDLHGEVTIGERGGAKLPNADFGNSPLEITSQRVLGKSVVISTTNGTECIRNAKSSDNTVLIGSLINCSAVAKAAIEIAGRTGSNISLVAAGRNNLPALEDRAAVTEIMKRIGNVTPRGTLEPFYSDELERDFLASESGMNLVLLGYSEDVIFCSKIDSSDAVPIFDGTRIVAYTNILK